MGVITRYRGQLFPLLCLFRSTFFWVGMSKNDPSALLKRNFFANKIISFYRSSSDRKLKMKKSLDKIISNSDNRRFEFQIPMKVHTISRSQTRWKNWTFQDVIQQGNIYAHEPAFVYIRNVCIYTNVKSAPPPNSNSYPFAIALTFSDMYYMKPRMNETHFRHTVPSSFRVL